MPEPLLPLVHKLKSGLTVRFRLAEPSDREALKRFYESLDTDSIYMRFLHIVRDFSKYVDSLLGGLNRYGFAVLAVVDDSRIIGLGEVFAKTREVAEFAVTVHPAYRRQGLGTSLAVLSAYEAYRRGIERLEAYIMSDNLPARRIAEKLGLKLVYTGMGVYRVTVHLPTSIATIEEQLRRMLHVRD